MSDTPRTDAFEQEWMETNGGTERTPLNFARILERELSAERAAREAAQREVAELRDALSLARSNARNHL